MKPVQVFSVFFVISAGLMFCAEGFAQDAVPAVEPAAATNPAPVPTVEPAAATNPAPVPAVEPAAATNPAPVPAVEPAAGECALWPENTLFKDGSVNTYRIGGDSSFGVSCTATRVTAPEGMCAAKVECRAEKSENQSKIGSEFPPQGYWIVDKNGYYHRSLEQAPDFAKGDKPNKCKRIPYAQCEEGTLVLEYSAFEGERPMIPTWKPKGMKIENCNETGECEVLTAARYEGSWCHARKVGDNVEKICIHEQKGILNFRVENEFGKMEARLK